MTEGRLRQVVPPSPVVTSAPFTSAAMQDLPVGQAILSRGMPVPEGWPCQVLQGCAWLARLLPELAGTEIEPLPGWTRRCAASWPTWREQLLSRVFPENIASRVLCRALGFREVGVLVRHAPVDGVWRDAVIVEKLLWQVPSEEAVSTGRGQLRPVESTWYTPRRSLQLVPRS